MDSSHLFQRVLHSYWTVSAAVEKRKKKCSHLFQRVASFLLNLLEGTFERLGLVFSSLSESGFIPTYQTKRVLMCSRKPCSHLFQRVASFLPEVYKFLATFLFQEFSSLSESGFIPTVFENVSKITQRNGSSHLFQRVASFLPK